MTALYASVSRGARGPNRLPLALAALTLVLAFALAESMPLLDPDEGRNAEVAREMASGRAGLLVPTLAGMPYLDKPPGYFWLAAPGLALAGPRPWAARLPSALAAALIVFELASLARRRDGNAGALRVAALLLAAPLFAVLAAYVIFDMPLAACVTMVWTGIARELDDGPSRARRLAMFGAVAAGLLLKGPVMLAWVLGGSVTSALLLRSRAPLSWLGWAPGWVLALGAPVAWFAAASARYPEYPHYAFLEESLERMSTGSFHRDQPVWFVPAVLVGGTLPWSLTTPWTRRVSRTGLVALAFVGFAAAFFAASRSKLVTYLLPAIPPLAWLAAESWADAARARRAAWRTAAWYVTIAIAAFVAVAVAVVSPGRLPPGSPGVLLGLALAWSGMAAAAAATRARPAWTVALNAGLIASLLGIGHPMLVRYARSQSGEPLARAITAGAPGAPVRYESCYSPGTDFLLGRTSTLVSRMGLETTSNYLVRYRTRLRARGEWTALDTIPPDGAGVIVRAARDPRPAPESGARLFRDGRFAAWRLATAETR